MKDHFSLSDVVDLVRRSGRTQDEMAASLGVSAAYISEILGGTRRPGPKILEALGLRSETVYLPK